MEINATYSIIGSNLLIDTICDEKVGFTEAYQFIRNYKDRAIALVPINLNSVSD
jgi:hypothetical protein